MKPHFFLIGASRCGTTTLDAALRKHPSIFLPRDKSPNFFVSEDLLKGAGSLATAAMRGHTVRTETEYAALFSSAPPGAVIGDVSPVYMQSTKCAARVAAYAPSAKVVAILRNPIDRAFAHYIGRKRDGLERRSTFQEAISSELEDPAPRTVVFNQYLAIGRYGDLLRPWFNSFAREQICILFFEDFTRDPVGVFNGMLSHLNVPPAPTDFPIQQKNKGGLIGNNVLREIWTRTALARAYIRPALPVAVKEAAGSLFLRSIQKPEFPEGLREAITNYYNEDTKRLTRLLEGRQPPWAAHVNKPNLEINGE